MPLPFARKQEPPGDIPLWIRYRDISRNVDQAIGRSDRRAFYYHARARSSVFAALHYLLERQVEHELIAAAVPEPRGDT